MSRRMPGADIRRLLGVAGLVELFGAGGVPKPRVRSRGGLVAGAVDPGSAVAGDDGLNRTPGAGIVSIGTGVETAGFGLAATTAGALASETVVETVGLVDEADFDDAVGDASTIRIGSSVALPEVVENSDDAKVDCGAGAAVIALRIVPPSADFVEPVGAVTTGGSVLGAAAVAVDGVEPDSVGVAAGG